MARRVWTCTREGVCLLPRVYCADHFFSRLKGLLGRAFLPLDEGLLILPCHSVHTLGMRFPIAVLFLDSAGQILHLIPDMPPGRISPVVKGARQVLELHPETCARFGLAQGQWLSFEAAPL